MKKFSKKILKEYEQNKLIRLHEKDGLTLACYTSKAFHDFKWDKVLVGTRGHVYDKDENLVGVSFDKIFNIGESEDTKVDRIIQRALNEPYHVYEKLNGHLVILFHYEGNWINTTKGSWDSDFIKEDKLVIDKQIELKGLEHEKHFFEDLKRYTLMFEMIAEHDKHLMFESYMERFKTNTPVLIDVIDNETGKSVQHRTLQTIASVIGAIVPDYYPELKISKIDEWFKVENTEGYVVYFPKSNFRFKVKTDWYLKTRYINTLISENNLNKLFIKVFTFDKVCEIIPEEFHLSYSKILKDYYTYKDVYIATIEGVVNSICLTNGDVISIIDKILETEDRGTRSAMFMIMNKKNISDKIIKKEFAEKYDFGKHFPTSGGFLD